jgi:putative lipoic acid-binding regulatory protein
MNKPPEMPVIPESESLVVYPSDFPLKIFGLQHPDFAQSVLEVVTRHAPDYDATGMEMRASKTAKYISLTCTIRATSRKQLDTVYQELVDHPLVKMVL